MRFAITGGTGFVGRHLARFLVSTGHEVVPIARRADRRDPGILHDLAPRPRFDFESIRRGLPAPGRFGLSDLRCCARPGQSS